MKANVVEEATAFLFPNEASRSEAVQTGRRGVALRVFSDQF